MKDEHLDRKTSKSVIVAETRTITIHALSSLGTDLLEVFLLGSTVLELTRKWAKGTTTSRSSTSGSDQLMMLLAGKLKQRGRPALLSHE